MTDRSLEMHGWLKFYHACLWIFWILCLAVAGMTLANIIGEIQSISFHRWGVKTFFVPPPFDPDHLIHLAFALPMPVTVVVYGVRILNQFRRRDPATRNSIVQFFAVVLIITLASILLLWLHDPSFHVPAYGFTDGFDYKFASKSVVFALASLIYFRTSPSAAAYFQSGIPETA